MRSVILAGIISAVTYAAVSAPAPVVPPAPTISRNLTIPLNGLAYSMVAVLDPVNLGNPAMFDGTLTQAWDVSINSYSERWSSPDYIFTDFQN